ncbi:MAG: hypothetical protein H0V81_17010 [Solirubrobacterales bacterium]|nr:hypothetical protein [Solirubrobacterales bacterium]
MPDLPARLAPYDHVLLDLDGCVRVGEVATPRADEAVAALRAAGRGVAFVTNDPALSPEDAVLQLWRLGVRASATEVWPSGRRSSRALPSSRSRTGSPISSSAPDVATRTPGHSRARILRFSRRLRAVAADRG